MSSSWVWVRPVSLLVLVWSVLLQPLAARAQPEVRVKVWRVGVLASRERPARLESDFYGEIPRGLSDLGYLEGKNLAIEWRFAGGHYDRFPMLARELVQVPVDVIITDGTPPTIAAQKATRSIPIVFATSSDPVGQGLVKSLKQPGGNTTGISLMSPEVAGKQVEMLKSTLPGLSRVAGLYNPANPAAQMSISALEKAARSVGIEVIILRAQTSREIENAFAAMVKEKAGAFISQRDPFLLQDTSRIVDLSFRHRLPGMSGIREFAEAGGLMSYGVSALLNYRRATVLVDKILRGTSPSQLPVEQPVKLELVLNQRAARALGIDFPAELLLLADKVID